MLPSGPRILNPDRCPREGWSGERVSASPQQARGSWEAALSGMWPAWPRPSVALLFGLGGPRTPGGRGQVSAFGDQEARCWFTPDSLGSEGSLFTNEITFRLLFSDYESDL